MSAASFRAALRVQGNVIGALILRELHTRFGRANIGYLWLFAEPMLLAVAVALLHTNHDLPIAGGIRPIPFAIAGYGLFILFRSVVSRAETVIEANRPLLHHRPVTIPDMLIARMVLEAVSTIVMLIVLLGGAWALGLADPLARPEAFAGAVALMCWFAFGLSMLVTAASHQSPVVGRLVHPLLYLSMPLSGAFFALSWFPQGVRDLLVWVPTVHIFELLKVGQFEAFESRWIDLPYVIGWCGALTLLGLLGLKHLRARIELS
ncbi:ABC transporter permease [Sphingomonas sp.]|uniref:ABC transporter permease n=1 Tax=Sphingomonas sp. TaxID=28214 RepID=UPI0017B64713|nr:ABC transporter permease [Sphingomonas sp.]MBA4760699.1 ABC transporter permease [Sphingomonas sp.]